MTETIKKIQPNTSNALSTQKEPISERLSMNGSIDFESNSAVNQNGIYLLHSKDSTLAFKIQTYPFVQPYIAYWGDRIFPQTTILDDEEARVFSCLTQLHETPASPSVETLPGLITTQAQGFVGASTIEAFSVDENKASDVILELTFISRSNDSLEFNFEDTKHALCSTVKVQIDYDSNMVSFQTTLENIGCQVWQLQKVASATIAIPCKIDQLVCYSGKWIKEFQQQTHTISTGAISKINRRGRTSHDQFPGLILKANQTTLENGPAYGFQLAWSGNHFSHTELLPEGFLYTQLGEHLGPGEITLEPSTSYQSPSVYGTYSSNGLNEIAQQFHQFIRARFHSNKDPRPIHYNTWEAQYFEHKPDVLAKLVAEASNIGVERFVLDDGWFKGRNNDQSGLGDWIPDPEKYPNGLHPLAEKIISSGMEFGLWLEPEMVNPDSELYQRNPHWILHSKERLPIEARNQLVLNLSLIEVQDFLYESISKLLVSYPIRYLKWDMNRDIHQPFDANGKFLGNKYIEGLYSLLDRIKQQFPHIAIESCASGGGRIDLGILEYTNRFWTSDSNDPIERIHIQKGFQQFFPPELMGSHVGPDRCHTTARRTDLLFRIATAFSGHFGIEADLIHLTDDEKQTLKSACDLYKSLRDHIHQAHYYLVESNSARQVVCYQHPQSNSIICFVSQLETDDLKRPKSIQLKFIDKDCDYQIKQLWPLTTNHSIWTDDFLSPKLNVDKMKIPGQLISLIGIPLPAMNPAQSVVIQLDPI